MSCDWARKLMVLADGLTKEERVELEKHLSQCLHCAAEWQKWQRLSALLRHLPSISSTPEERAELLKQLAQVPSAPELDCAAARSMIWRWIDGDLTSQERAGFVAHLANCDRCQSTLWQAEQTVLMLRSLPKLKATAAEKEALKARLRRMVKRPTIVPFVWRVAFPIAAAAALALLVFANWQHPLRDQTTVAIRQPTTPETKTEPSKREPVAPKIAERPLKPHQQPVYRQPRYAMAQLPQQKPKQVQKPTNQQTQTPRIAEAKVKAEVKRVAVPEPSAAIKPESKPVPEVRTLETLVAEEPKLVTPPAITAPLPPEPSERVLSPAMPTGQVPTTQLVQAPQESPIAAPITSEPRRLIELPPVTIEGDIPLQPPRVKLTMVPPSQRLYQKSGVALVTVPPEKRPVRAPEEQALTPDLSIPLAAERYRSHTASIPFFRFGISW
ncbi:MAG: zf-HC2 domain-containing protein [Candidatus Fervidibacter sacchari]